MRRREFLEDSLRGFAGLSGLPTFLPAWGAFSKSTSAEGEANLKSYWPARSPHLFHDGLEEGIGFTFTYGNQKAFSVASPGWQVSTKTMASAVETTFRHSSGLTAVRRVQAYPEYEAIAYSVTFKNEGASTLPALGPVNAMDLKFGKTVLLGSHVVSSGGGLADSIYPPEAYAIREHWIGPMTPVNGQVTLTTEGGRSSNKDLPFYFVQNDGGRAGIFVAIGWTGQWGFNDRRRF